MTPADRARQYRERVRLGIRVVPTPVSCDEVQVLIAAGLLDERDEASKPAVADALKQAALLLPFKKRDV